MGTDMCTHRESNVGPNVHTRMRTTRRALTRELPSVFDYASSSLVKSRAHDRVRLRREADRLACQPTSLPVSDGNRICRSGQRRPSGQSAPWARTRRRLVSSRVESGAELAVPFSEV
ncbi:unnamed protein product [Protopolystoma xenopodis]|uniref:Uncharacterized protein n=1 Tax=Protopolystoma xenopodis TaxID=117903 RepID=A0A448X1S4_9PLAT|nr:unnamed protein product [Protopolystoma xenopodis]